MGQELRRRSPLSPDTLSRREGYGKDVPWTVGSPAPPDTGTDHTELAGRQTAAAVCGRRADDACWQRRSRQSGCIPLTLVRPQICKHAGTKGQGSWNGNFPRGLECSWPCVQALYSVCVIHQKRGLWVNLVALEPQTDGDPDVSSCGNNFLPTPAKHV